MHGYFPSLDALNFVMENFAPKDMTIDEFDAIINKISTIHSMRRSAYLAG